MQRRKKLLYLPFKSSKFTLKQGIFLMKINQIRLSCSCGQGVKFTLLAAGLVLALSFTLSCSSDGGGNGNDISNYRTVKIGDQTWMAENLDYVVEGSKCYNNNSANCDKYGSLYNWSTAMALPSSCNSSTCSSQIQSKHKGICPSGWHIPSYADWDILLRYVDAENDGYGDDSPYYSYTAGMYLKATTGWNNNGNGTDQYGFSALPGGRGYSNGSFYFVGNSGFWWSASYDGDYSDNAYLRFMYYDDNNDDDAAGWDYSSKSYLQSVRCVQD